MSCVNGITNKLPSDAGTLSTFLYLASYLPSEACINCSLRKPLNLAQFNSQPRLVDLIWGLQSSCKLQCESIKIPPAVFWHFIPNGWEFLNQLLHTYYTFLSTLDYRFLFNYLHLAKTRSAHRLEGWHNYTSHEKKVICLTVTTGEASPCCQSQAKCLQV